MNSVTTPVVVTKPADAGAFQRLIAVSERKKSGLILCKGYHAEFTGPGAAICTAAESEYSSVFVIGSPEIIEVVTQEDRQRAYSRRIQWLRWLERITDDANPTNRAEKLLYSLEAFFDTETLTCLPDLPLALLAGVLPQTMAMVRSQLRSRQSLDETSPSHLAFCSAEVRMLDPKALSRDAWRSPGAAQVAPDATAMPEASTPVSQSRSRSEARPESRLDLRAESRCHALTEPGTTEAIAGLSLGVSCY